MERRLTVGSPVIVSFDPHDICVTDDMKQYNGLETNVSRVHIPRIVRSRQFGPQYELKDVVSTVGKIPYTFTRDMITDAEEAINAND